MVGILNGSLTAVGLIHTGCSNQRNTRSKYQIMMTEPSYEGGEHHYNMTVFVSFVGIRRPVNKNKSLFIKILCFNECKSGLEVNKYRNEIKELYN